MVATVSAELPEFVESYSHAKLHVGFACHVAKMVVCYLLSCLAVPEVTVELLASGCAALELCCTLAVRQPRLLAPFASALCDFALDGALQLHAALLKLACRYTSIHLVLILQHMKCVRRQTSKSPCLSNISSAVPTSDTQLPFDVSTFG